MWISPNYQHTDFEWPLKFDDKVKLFFDRVSGWQLDIADLCVNGGKDLGGIVHEPIRGAGFGALFISFSYFELIARYEAGSIKKGESRNYFKRGVFSVFPSLKKEKDQGLIDSLLDVLYENARCGLYHHGMTGKGIVLTGEIEQPIISTSNPKQLIINPHLLVPVLKSHLVSYIEQLRDPAKNLQRHNFEKRFDHDMS